MDEQIKKAFETANYMTTLASQKQILKEEFYQNLIHYYNGGIFTASRELINFVKTLVDIGNNESAVLVDNNELPVDIADLSKFLEDLLSKYHFAVNGYYTRYDQMRKNRTVEGILSV